MKKNVNYFKILFFLGLIGFFGSCEKEDVTENATEVQNMNLEEAPFKNYMVITKDNQLSKSAEDLLKASGGNIISSIPEIGIAIVESNDKDFMQKTMKGKGIQAVVPDYEVKWIPSGNVQEEGIGEGEFFFDQKRLWGMDAINAPEAWDLGFRGKGASVFVLDSGLNPFHPDLAPNVNSSLSISFIQGETWFLSPQTGFNHGTHVAGTIAAADTNYGIIGVAPEAELVAVKVLSEFSGSGPFSSINAGIVYAANNGADVINMSLGATLNKNGKLIDADGNEYRISPKDIQEIIHAQQRAIDYAFNKGVTVIASAGNDAVNYDGNAAFVKLPGGMNNVITVSATAPEGYDRTATTHNYDVPASYTTYGRSLIDVAAPGGDFDVNPPFDMILSAGNGTGFYWSAGTSMAAPHVSGVAALIIGKNGKMNPKEVARQIENTSDKIDGNGQSLYFGKGRINALRAVTE